MEETKDTFDNADRKRYYGVRVGDIVEIPVFGSSKVKGEVVEYDPSDNNNVFVKTEDGKVKPMVAEWCEIQERVEDRKVKSV